MTKTEQYHNKLIPLLIDKPHTREELMYKLHLNRRTISRYLAELSKFGYELKKDGQRNIKYSICRKEKVITPDDILILEHTIKELMTVGNIKQVSELEFLVNKMKTISAKNESEDFYNFYNGNEIFSVAKSPNSVNKINNTKVAKLYEKIKKKEKIKLTYNTPYKPEQTSIFLPYALSLRNGQLYLIGMYEDNNELRTLKVDRIKRIVSQVATFIKPKEFSVDDYFKNSFGSFSHKTSKTIKIRILDLWFENYLKESYIHSTKRIYEFDDEVYLEIKVGIDFELAGWILSWGGHIEVIEPQELIELIEENS